MAGTKRTNLGFVGARAWTNDDDDAKKEIALSFSSACKGQQVSSSNKVRFNKFSSDRRRLSSVTVTTRIWDHKRHFTVGMGRLPRTYYQPETKSPYVHMLGPFWWVTAHDRPFLW
jgi:hypothetical protein